MLILVIHNLLHFLSRGGYRNGIHTFISIPDLSFRWDCHKYLLWMNILKAEDPRFSTVIFNGKNCKYTLISMNNTKVIERNGKFDKDKNSEKSKKILPEEATHFSYAADKRIWTKYGKALYTRASGTYLEPRLYKKK